MPTDMQKHTAKRMHACTHARTHARMLTQAPMDKQNQAIDNVLHTHLRTHALELYLA